MFTLGLFSVGVLLAYMSAVWLVHEIYIERWNYMEVGFQVHCSPTIPFDIFFRVHH